MTDIQAARCRKLFAAVLLAQLDEFNGRYNKQKRLARGKPEAVAVEARRYLSGSSARYLAALAGIDIDLDRAIKAVMLSRDEYKRLTHKDDRHA